MTEIEFLVDETDTLGRIDVFITNKLEKTSRSSVQKYLEEQKVTVNGKFVKANYKICTLDKITVKIEDPLELEVVAEDIKLDIIYEDSEVIVINKPQNMVVHPAPGHYSGTLVNALLFHCRSNLSGINGVLRPGIVHRIDKDTSGILVVAKTNEAHQSLTLQLQNHSMVRKYYAIVYGNVKEDNGTIDKSIGRHKTERKKMAVSEKNSKNAITHYKVLKRFKGYTFIEASLETGRTHQIRVHMSYIGHPLLGDSVYGKANTKLNLIGQVLHAKMLGFIHPTTNEYMEFNSELPKYFLNLLNIL